MRLKWKFLTQMLELIDIHSLFSSALICKTNRFLSPPSSHIFDTIGTPPFINDSISQLIDLRIHGRRVKFTILASKILSITGFMFILHRNQSLFWFGRFDDETGNCSFNTLQNCCLQISHRFIVVHIDSTVSRNASCRWEMIKFKMVFESIV